MPDAGSDGGVITFGTPGPWPTGNVVDVGGAKFGAVTYGAADGILEYKVVGVTTDEPVTLPGPDRKVTQNLWVATNSALYLLRPGETKFRRYDGTTGMPDPTPTWRDPVHGSSVGHRLHLQNNPVSYCDRDFARGDKSCPIYGAAADPGISEIIGGGPNEVFVGYYGAHDWNLTGNQSDGVPIENSWADPDRHTGKLDRVRLNQDGTIDVVRFDMVAGNSVEFWHNRTVMRMVYDHFIHKHELYVGTEHGVNKFSPDLWYEPNPSWPYGDYGVWMSDHLHPMSCLHQLCTGNSGLDTEMMSQWRGLALTASGDLWVGGKFGAGKILYTAPNTGPNGTSTGWYQRGGDSYESPTHGFQFCGTAGHEFMFDTSTHAWVDQSCSPGSGTPPIFVPPMPGDPVAISAVTVTPDGKTWWASGGEATYGIASMVGHHQPTYFDPIRDAGMSETNVQDMLALPDGRLVLAGPNSGLVFWDPVTGKHTAMRAGQGIPSDQVYRLELDMTVDPPALHVSTAGGAVVLRVLK